MKRELSKKKHNKRLRLYEQGLKDKDIAKAEGVTASAITHWRRNNNLKQNYHKKYYKLDELHSKGMTDLEISRKLDVSRKTVKAWRIQKGLKVNKQIFREHKKDEKDITPEIKEFLKLISDNKDKYKPEKLVTAAMETVRDW